MNRPFSYLALAAIVVFSVLFTVPAVFAEPEVILINTTLGDGTYGTGTLISIYVQYNESVNITGTPRLELDFAPGLDKNATYVGGDTTSNVLEFQYTTVAGDNTTALDYTSVNAFTLNGATIIANLSGATAINTLPAVGPGSLSDGRNIEVDAIAPFVTGVNTPDADATYGANIILNVTVTFDDAIEVTGSPRIELNFDSAPDRNATYVSGNGTTTLLFQYTTTFNDAVADLDYVATSSLTLNGGTLASVITGDFANRTLAAPGAAGSLGNGNAIAVNAVLITITDIDSPSPFPGIGLVNGIYGAGTVINFTVGFSAPVTITGVPHLELELGAIDGNATYVSDDTTTAIFTYTVQLGDNASDLGYSNTVNSLTLNGGTIFDVATGLLPANLTVPFFPTNYLSLNKDIIIDAIEPVIDGGATGFLDGVTVGPNVFVSNTTPTFNFTVTDTFQTGLTYTLWINDAAAVTAAATEGVPSVIILPAQPVGVVLTTYVEVSDGVNNKTSTSYDMIVDDEAPVVVVNSSLANNTLNLAGTLVWTVNVTDNLQSNISIGIANLGDTTCTEITPYSVLNNTVTSVPLADLYPGLGGSYTFVNLTVCAIDSINSAFGNNYYTLTVDLVNPTLTVFAPITGNRTNDTTPLVFFTANDDVASYLNYSIMVDGALNRNGNITQGNNASVNLTALSQGTHTIIVNVTDDVGRYNESSPIVIFVDTGAPTATLLQPINNTNVTTSVVPFNFTGIDALATELNYTLYLNGTANGSGNFTNGTNVSINRTLAAGTWNWTVSVTDNAGNVNTPYALNFTVSASAPVMSGEDGAATRNAATLTINTDLVAECRYSTTDQAYSAMTNVFTTTNATSHETSVTGLSAFTSYTYYVRCSSSGSATTSSAQIDFTTLRASSGGGGGGGSSSRPGTTVSGAPGVTTRLSWARVNAGETVEAPIALSGMPVTRFAIAFDQTSSNFNIEVRSLTERPSTLVAPAQTVYMFLQVTPTGLTDEAVRSATMTFAVPKSWLTSNNIGEGNVVLMRYTDRWVEIPATVVSSDATTVTFSAETPYFSYFAIAGKPTATVTPTPAPASPSEPAVAQPTPAAPAAPPAAAPAAPVETKPTAKPVAAPVKGSNGAVFWVSIVLVLAVLGAGLVYMRSRKKSRRSD